MRNTQNTYLNGYENKSPDELKIIMAQMSQQGRYDEAQKVLTELQKKENAGKPIDETEKFGEKYGEQQKKIKELQGAIKKLEEVKERSKEQNEDLLKKQEEEKRMLQDFFTKDIKTYQSKIKGNMQEINDARDKKLIDLQAQLNDTITTLPTIGEYFSLERRRLVSIHTKIKEYKEKDLKNYPKNFLIYAMGLTNHALLGTRQGLKRSRVKLARKRKSDDIKSNLKVLEDKLSITNDDKKPRKRSLKLLISKEVQEAKLAQLEKNKESLGLAA